MGFFSLACWRLACDVDCVVYLYFTALVLISDWVVCLDVWLLYCLGLWWFGLAFMFDGFDYLLGLFCLIVLVCLYCLTWVCWCFGLMLLFVGV